MTTLGWLHLSDLHQGLRDQSWLWPSVKERFFEDLERLHRRAGPWDLVLFTGDLTQSGKAKELERLTATLDSIWGHLGRLGSHPLLVAVPGNHDLVRPDPKRAVVKVMRQWHEDRDLRDQLLTKRGGEVYRMIEKAFAPFTTWQRAWAIAHPPPAGAIVEHGALPGDVSVLLEKEGLRFGIVGLSSAFLQLEGGDYEGRLDVDVRQLHAVCDGDAPEWLAHTHASLLLTHHPPEWLRPEARARFRELIAPPGRFVAHLYGHMHEPTAQFHSVAGAAVQRTLQAASVFGLETWGDGTQERIHGYSAGRIDADGVKGTLRIWPRILQKRLAGDRVMVADHRYTLEEDESFGDRFELRPGCGAKKQMAGTSAATAQRDMLAEEVERYRHAVAADRSQGLLSWEDLGGGLEATGERDLLRIFVVPTLAPLKRMASDPAAEVSPEPAQPAEPADDVLFDERRPWALVLGGPGAGKSALVGWVQLRLCVPGEAPAGAAGAMVPVRLTLRSLEQRRREASGADEDLFRLFEAELGPGGLRANDLRALAEAGRITWIFDGLDEVVAPEALAWHARMIADLKNRCRGRGIITSRLAGAERTRPILEAHGVRSFTILDLDDERIHAWIDRWYEQMAIRAPEAAARRRDRLLAALSDHTFLELRALCRTPLLLTLVAGLARHGDLPSRQREVYARVVSHLVDEWETAKGIAPDVVPFNYEDKERFLRRLAWTMMTELAGGGGNMVTRLDLTRFAVRFCQEELRQSHAVAGSTARAIVDRLRDRHGILALQGDDRYGFMHRALLDYMAAEEIVERAQRERWDRRRLGALLRERWNQILWRECITRVLEGISERRADLVVAALQHVLCGVPVDDMGYQYYWSVEALTYLHHAEPDPLNQVTFRSFVEQLSSFKTQILEQEHADGNFSSRRMPSEPTLLHLAETADDPAIREDAEQLLSLLHARRRLLQVGRLRRGVVSLAGQRVGVIEELSGGRTRFTYDPAWLARPDARPLGPSMPLRHAPYEDEGLLPFFENLLPEGWLLNIARRKLGVAANDPFGLLLATCSDCIGAVEINPMPDEDEA